MKHIAIALVKLYQVFISPLFPPSCRFYPSCSEYAVQSIKKFGLLKGVWYTAKRISKCHPFHPGGYDPVK
ncbi:MAG: membrane protein insertion efficiency factor YidD [bacterium]